MRTFRVSNVKFTPNKGCNLSTAFALTDGAEILVNAACIDDVERIIEKTVGVTVHEIHVSSV